MNPASEHEIDPTFTAPEDDADYTGDHGSGGFYTQAGGYVPYSPSLAPMTFHAEPQDYTHYVPPSAISTRYYALSNPYAYPAEQPTHSAMHAGNPLPAEAAPAGAPATAPPAVTAEGAPQTSFTTSTSPARVDPVLPKQRRNRDDPGGESRPLAQPASQHEELQPGRRGPAAAAAAFGAPAGGAGFHYARAQTPPAIVPSQWKLGAALDDLRFSNRVNDRRTTAMAASSSQPYPPTRPGPSSPLSREDAARLAALKMQLGLHDGAERAGPSTSAAANPSPSASAPGTDSEGEYVMNKSAIYSPTTGRKLALSAEPGGKASVQIVPGTTSAKRPYKRGTPVACAFCRKRKIACGGPQEGDEARRCGPCIQRQQACEFPASAQRPLSRNRYSAGYTGPVVVREFK